MDYKDTTIIIPVKGEPAVGKVAKEVLQKLPKCRVIVIHKGELAIGIKNPNLQIIEQKSSGKGRAVVEASKHVKTKIMCFIDGDDTYDVDDLKKVVALVRDGAAMALGDRMGGVTKEVMPAYIQLGNLVLTITMNWFYGLRLGDSQTGLRAIRTNIFKSLALKEPQFGVESEMDIKCAKKKLKVVETPAHYYVREGLAKHFKPLGGLKLLYLNFKLLL